MYDELLAGTRPELRSDCPQELVSLLTDCWNTECRSRPSFKEICTRLETFRHKILRGFSTVDQGFHEERVDGSTGFDFIKKKMEEQSSINKDEFVDTQYSAAKGHEGYEISEIEAVVEISGIEAGVEIKEAVKVSDINKNDVVSIITCTMNHALELLRQSEFYCNMCRKPDIGSVYHCKTCGFDAHPDCAELKKKVTILFRNAPLHLQIQNNCDDLDATCGFCQVPLQDGEWLYKSEQGSFYAHALCTKYPSEMELYKHSKGHLLTLVESPPGTTCGCCSNAIQGYYYTCSTYWCSFELHPLCAILPAEPRMIMKDTPHGLSLVADEPKAFRCGKCDTAYSISWFYRCEPCGMKICVGCMGS